MLIPAEACSDVAAGGPLAEVAHVHECASELIAHPLQSGLRQPRLKRQVPAASHIVTLAAEANGDARYGSTPARPLLQVQRSVSKREPHLCAAEVSRTL